MSLEQYSKATQETAENLRIIDDAMFRLVVERKGVCQEILRTLLDKSQLRVVRVTSQSVMTSLHREITLDALCILENDEYVNIEMQKGSGNDDMLFLCKDVFEDVKFPNLSKAVKYFKETEGGLVEMCKTVEDYARNYAEDYAREREKIGRSEERVNAIRKMLKNGFAREVILSLDYSEAELEAAEKDFKKN